MHDIANFFTSTDNVLIIGLMIAIIVLLVIIMILDIRTRRHNIKENDDLLEVNLNDDHDEVKEIKYVEENAELEKTQAKIELENLKQELMRQEEAKDIEPVVEVNSVKEETPIMKESVNLEEAVVEDVNSLEAQVNRFEDEQESSAIISVEELQKKAESLHGSEIVMAHEDEGNEPISLAELEALYKKVETPKEIKEENIVVMPSEFNLNSTEEKPSHFTSSPIISPVYGIDDRPKENSLDNINLEQTANLDKLNEELKKVNEFLAVLKELRSKL